MKKTKAIYLVAVFAVSALLLSSVNAQTIPEEARRHMARGQAAVEMAKSPDEYDSAIKEFQQASRLAPNWPDPYYNLGLVQEKAGKLREAITSLNRYLQLAPGAPDAAKVNEQIYKIEYKVEQVLSVSDVIDVLVLFSNKELWEKVGGESFQDKQFTFIKRKNNNSVELPVWCTYDYYNNGRPNSRGGWSSNEIKGPIFKWGLRTEGAEGWCNYGARSGGPQKNKSLVGKS